MRNWLFDAGLNLLPALDHKPSGVQTIHHEIVVPHPLSETFAFFAAATNLERITPPWLDFRIRSPLPIEMQAGTIIDYQIVVNGLPIPWRTRIDIWEPGVRFVDRQVAGPYLWWHHEHRFTAASGGTRVIDHVEYMPRFQRLTSSMVSRDVNRIFAYRRHTLLTQWASVNP